MRNESANMSKVKMNKEHLPWVEKYRPRSLSDVFGQEAPAKKIYEFIISKTSANRSANGGAISSTKNTGKGKALIIYGKSGSGKTSIPSAISSELSYELLEINASDFRSANAVEQTIGPAISQQSLFFSGKVILIDEIDCLAREDRGGASEILRLVETSKYPVIMTANDPYDDKLSGIRKKSELVQLNALNYSTVRGLLLKIRNSETSSVSDDIVNELAIRASGDLRAAITDLQCLSAIASKRKITSGDVELIGERERSESLPSAIAKILKSTDMNVALASVDNIEENHDTLFLWLEENLPKEYTGKNLVNALNILSYADVLRGRIIRRQHWRFLSYIMQLLTAGIALSKDEKSKEFVQYKRSDRILQMWIAKNRWSKAIEISGKLAEQTHCSKKQTRKNTLPYIKRSAKNKIFAKAISEELKLEPEQKEWLLA